MGRSGVGARFHAADAGRAESLALTEVSRLFAEAASDLDSLCQALTRHAATALKDGCVLRLVRGPTGRSRTVALHHVDAEAQALLANLRAETPEAFDEADAFSQQVLRTNHQLLMPRVSSVQLQLWTSPLAWPALERLHPHSVLVVPVGYGGRVIGTLSAWRDRTRLAYTEDDGVFLQTLTTRVAIAIARVLPR